ncbi:MAG: patatin-like phospholipase family protein [Longimicrobiales bacterium]
MTEARRPRIGLALGGGGARGWAHIGVLNALDEHGLKPDIVCGTSIGALVGGIYAAGKVRELGEWVGGLGRRDVISLVDFTIGGGGVIGLRRLMRLYREHLGEPRIEDLDIPFAAVATDLEAWSEVWLRSGSLLSAIRASIAIPGIFTPVHLDGRWLMDGGVVNPVPVSLCRALGADLVIAVDLQVGPAMNGAGGIQPGAAGAGVAHQRPESHRGEDATTEAEIEAESKAAPAMSQVIIAALEIMQYRIGRSRLAGDPPDLVLTPRVSHVHPLAFAGGQPVIDEGYDTVQRMLPALRYASGLPSHE